MEIQLQVLNMHALKNPLYIIKREQKAPFYKLFCSKAPKTQQVASYEHMRKTSGLLFMLLNGRLL